MGNEIAIAPNGDIPPQEQAYISIKNRAHITATIRQLSTTANTSVALVAVHLAYQNAKTPEPALLAEQAVESSAYVLQNIRSMVRKTDYVFLHQHDLYFVLAGANLQGAMIVEERLWEALLWRVHNMSEQHLPRPLGITIGHGAYPQPQNSPEALLEAAAEVSKRFNEPSERTGLRGLKRNGHKAAARQEAPEELPQLAKKLGIPYLSLLPRQLPQRLQQVVNAKLAHELHCYPVGRARNTLTVAMLDPQDRHALERLSQETGLRIFPVLAHPEALENALKQLS